jgi:hypothetical protein
MPNLMFSWSPDRQNRGCDRLVIQLRKYPVFVTPSPTFDQGQRTSARLGNIAERCFPDRQVVHNQAVRAARWVERARDAKGHMTGWISLWSAALVPGNM